MTSKDKKSIYPKFGIVVIVALAIRLFFVLATQHIGSPDSMDAGTYHSIALNLLEGKGYSEDGINPSIFVAPLYPFFLFIFYKIFGVYPLLIEILHSLLGVGTGVFIFLLTKKYVPDTTAFIAALIVLFIPDLIIITTFLYTETLFVFLFRVFQEIY